MAESAKKQKSQTRRCNPTPRSEKNDKTTSKTYVNRHYPIPGLQHIKIFLGAITQSKTQKTKYKIDPGLGTYSSVTELFAGYVEDKNKQKLKGINGTFNDTHLHCCFKIYIEKKKK
eukprot:99924_1